MIIGTIVTGAVRLSNKVGWTDARKTFMPREVCDEVQKNFDANFARIEKKIDRLLELNGNE